jgi:hypothetical protein
VFQSRNYGFSDAMTIDSSGRVGIGTSAPATELEIKGNQPQLTLNTNTTGYTGLIFATNGVNDGGIYYNSTDDKLEFYTADTSGGPQVVVDATGRLGVGTTSPSFPLHLVTSTTSYVAAETTGTGASAGFRLIGSASADYTIFTTQGVNQFAIYEPQPTPKSEHWWRPNLASNR